MSHLQDKFEEEREYPVGSISVKVGSFSWALAKLKQGAALTRSSWNAKGQFVYMVWASQYPAQTGVAHQYFGPDSLVPYEGYFALKNAQDKVVVWVPSTGDLLAEDWAVAELPHSYI